MNPLSLLCYLGAAYSFGCMVYCLHHHRYGWAAFHTVSVFILIWMGVLVR